MGMFRGQPKVNTDNYYQSLLGDTAWRQLHPAIRKRFSGNQQACYWGIMKEIRLSFAGKILARLGTLIGTPLALHCGTHIPISVSVYYDTLLKGYTWDRFYHFNQGDCRVTSTKRLTDDGKLIEQLGRGVSMRLQISEHEGALKFTSRDYYWHWRGLRIRIPRFLSPGTTTVKQAAIDASRFVFELSVDHPVFGKIAWQHGEFCVLEENNTELLLNLIEKL